MRQARMGLDAVRLGRFDERVAVGARDGTRHSIAGQPALAADDYDIHAAHQSPIAAEAFERSGRRYGVKSEIRGRPPDERASIHKARARPELDALQGWPQRTPTTVSKKSELAVSIRYAVSHGPALVRYRDDGRLEIDNNAVERSLRAVALARKNGCSRDPTTAASALGDLQPARHREA